MLRFGLLLGFTAVFLQIAVFLQPLLPKQYQIAPVCETITQLLVQTKLYDQQQHMTQHGHLSHGEHVSHEMGDQNILTEKNRVDDHSLSSEILTQTHSGHDHHDLNHQCQYCTVYAHLVLPPELEIQEVLSKIHVRLIAFQKTFRHVYFVLQRLYLLPQGRAPPIFA